MPKKEELHHRYHISPSKTGSTQNGMIRIGMMWADMDDSPPEIKPKKLFKEGTKENPIIIE